MNKYVIDSHREQKKKIFFTCCRHQFTKDKKSNRQNVFKFTKFFYRLDQLDLIFEIFEIIDVFTISS